MSLPARLLALLAALLLATAAGWRQGVRSTLADWRAADLAAERAAADARSEQQRLATRAAASYEATRAAGERRHADTITSLRRALGGSPSCPAGASAPLADLLVPADAVAGLRAAGSDLPAGAGPAPTEPGR